MNSHINSTNVTKKTKAAWIREIALGLSNIKPFKKPMGFSIDYFPISLICESAEQKTK